MCLGLALGVHARNVQQVVARQKDNVLIGGVEGVAEVVAEAFALPAQSVLDVRVREHLSVKEVTCCDSNRVGGPLVEGLVACWNIVCG